MLPWRKTAQVDGGQPADGDGADTIEECVYVADVELAIAGVEDAGEDEWSEGAVPSALKSFGKL